MARDKGLEEMLSENLAGTSGLTQKAMFGGIAWLVNGNLLCGASTGGMLVRLGKDNDTWALEIPGIALTGAAGNPLLATLPPCRPGRRPFSFGSNKRTIVANNDRTVIFHCKSIGGIMPPIVRIHGYGDPSVLKIEDIEVPPPASGEVQIEVKSIGFNRAEVMFRTHAYPQEAHFPSRLGYEAAGIVKAIGADVSGFTAGDLITRRASVEVIGQKRPTSIYLESATYDWFGLIRASRNGFDSRYILDLSIRWIRSPVCRPGGLTMSVVASQFFAAVREGQ